MAKEIYLFFTSVFPGAAIIGVAEPDEETKNKAPIVDERGFVEVINPLNALSKVEETRAVDASGQPVPQIAIMFKPVTILMPGDPMRIKLEAWLGPIKHEVAELYQRQIQTYKKAQSPLVLP